MGNWEMWFSGIEGSQILPHDVMNFMVVLRTSCCWMAETLYFPRSRYVAVDGEGGIRLFKLYMYCFKMSHDTVDCEDDEGRWTSVVRTRKVFVVDPQSTGFPGI